MSIDYAIERLYQSGWSPGLIPANSESLEDGRRIPSLAAIEREFQTAGLRLVIEHSLIFNSFRATWTPIEDSDGGSPVAPALNAGTVIGASEREAAVFALAQLRESQGVQSLLLA